MVTGLTAYGTTKLTKEVKTIIYLYHVLDVTFTEVPCTDVVLLNAFSAITIRPIGF